MTHTSDQDTRIHSKVDRQINLQKYGHFFFLTSGFTSRINNDFSFDDAVNKEYGCEAHSFDPRYGFISISYNNKTFPPPPVA